MILESTYNKIIREMQKQGRVTALSQEEAYNLEHRLAMGLIPIKEEFYRKSRASRNYIKNLELKTSEI
jgi:hypothetical protein